MCPSGCARAPVACQVLDCILRSCLGMQEEYSALGDDLEHMVAGGWKRVVGGWLGGWADG